MSLELDWPVDGLEPLSFLLARVLEPLCAGLVRRGRRAATLALELGLVDGSVHRRTLKPAAPSVEPRTWRTLVLLDLEVHPPARRDPGDHGAGGADSRPLRPVLAPRSRAALARRSWRRPWPACTSGRRRAGAAPPPSSTPTARALSRWGRSPPAPRRRVPPASALRGWPCALFRPPRRADVVLRGGRSRLRGRVRRSRGRGGLRRSLARLRRLVGRGLEPRGVGRGPRGRRRLPHLPRPAARSLVRGGRAGLT